MQTLTKKLETGLGGGQPGGPAQGGGFAMAPMEPKAETVISADLTIIGNVTSRGNVKLNGTIEGDIHCTSLVVSENGEIKGGIVANNEVMVHGKVNGFIRGRRVLLYSTARVEGDIFHQGIGIEMGTRYDGSLRWTDDNNAFQQGSGDQS